MPKDNHMVFKDDIQAAYTEQQSLIQNNKEAITREYLSQMKTPSRHIEVISGIRRCGKSTLMIQIINKYYRNAAYFNFEDSRIYGFEVSDFSVLNEVMGKNNEAYFFDEIQNVKGWEIFVRQLHERGEKVYVTGSNASLLSRELGTRLTGRFFGHEISPFSYTEFLEYQGLKDTVSGFESYIQKGGFPEFLRDNKTEILQTLLKDIVFRDIAIRHGIKNTDTLMGITLYLLSNIGKEISFNGIRKTFGVGSPATVSDYLSWLEDSYLLFFLPRFSWSAKSISKNRKKVYAIDTGLINSNSLSFSKDKGRLLENVVYLNLRKNDHNLFYFRENRECDFVVFYNQSCKWVIQVCEKLHHDNRDREINGLMEAMSFFNMDTGYILTNNQEERLLIKDRVIFVQPVRKFFKAEQS